MNNRIEHYNVASAQQCNNLPDQVITLSSASSEGWGGGYLKRKWIPKSDGMRWKYIVSWSEHDVLQRTELQNNYDINLIPLNLN